MSQIDLTRFYGFDPARLNVDDLDTVRHAFAAAVVDFAATVRDNRELLTGLAAAMPPESGLPLPRILGEGSTHRAWSLPFGLTLKLERTDPLTADEMSWRGSVTHLRKRRRIAVVNEVSTSIVHR